MRTFFQIRENIKFDGETSINELTAAEKKLINQMYDKKGNLTPLGKRVMDHGKAASKLTPKDAAADKARRKEYNAYQKSKRNEEVELDEAPRRKRAPKMTGDSVAIQRAKDAEHNKAMGRTKTGRKKPVRTMTSTQRSLASLRNEGVELDEGIEKTYVKMMQVKLKELQKVINPTSAIGKKVIAASDRGKEFKQISNSLTDVYDTLTDIDMNIKENAMMKMKLINKMKKASPAAKKALEAPSRVDKKKEETDLDEISVKDVANQVMMKTKADAARKHRGRNIGKLKTDLARLKKGLKKPLNAQNEEKDPALKRAGVSGFNKPKRTPGHATKSHIVVTKVNGKPKTIRFGQQGASTAGDPKEGESDKMKAKRKSFKARHSKNIAKGKSSAAYWADKEKW